MYVLDLNSMINHCIRLKTILSGDGLTVWQPRLHNNSLNNKINILTNARIIFLSTIF